MTIKGIVKDGVIKPVEDIKLPENEEVSINLSDKKKPNVIIIDEKDKKEIEKARLELERISKRIEERMQGKNRNKITTQEEIDADCF